MNTTIRTRKVNILLKSVNDLNEQELQLVYNAILEKMNKKANAIAALQRIKGIGKGVWNMDAQDYINELRDNDRF
jgi:hypothetical protein